jgi:hypothetical protein
MGEGTPLDRRGLTWGLIAVAIVVALAFIGSDRLVWFDAALVGYLFGTIFAVFGVTYRYAVWLRRPPTAMLNRRGWDAFRARRSTTRQRYLRSNTMRTTLGVDGCPTQSDSPEGIDVARAGRPTRAACSNPG